MTTDETSEQEDSDTTGEQIPNHDPEQADSPAHEIERVTQIPSLLTNSMRVVLDTFGEDIIHLRANGGVETANSTLLDQLRKYGMVWEQHDRQRMVIDYEQLPGNGGEPMNPLTEEVCEEIFDETEARLGPTNTGVDQDLAVTSCTIRVTNERLAAVTPAQTPEFDLTFVSDAPLDPDVEQVTRDLNARRGLYDDLGFKIRNLNLRGVIETAAIYHEQSDGRCMSWGGPSDLYPRSPERLAVRINQEILPERYGFLKKYRVTEDSRLKLADDSLNKLLDFDPMVTTEPIGGDD